MGNFANNDAICIELVEDGVPLARVISVVEVSKQRGDSFRRLRFLAPSADSSFSQIWSRFEEPYTEGCQERST